jgi:hypothetical protein
MDWFKEMKWDGFTYVSSKFIMSIAFVLILCIALFSLNYSKFSGNGYYYIECSNNLMTGRCVNTYFESNLCTDGTILEQNLPYGEKLCSTEFMFPGERIGEKPPWLVRNFSYVGGLILFVALLLNTLIYNKGFFKWIKDK